MATDYTQRRRNRNNFVSFKDSLEEIDTLLNEEDTSNCQRWYRSDLNRGQENYENGDKTICLLKIKHWKTDTGSFYTYIQVKLYTKKSLHLCSLRETVWKILGPTRLGIEEYLSLGGGGIKNLWRSKLAHQSIGGITILKVVCWIPFCRKKKKHGRHFNHLYCTVKLGSYSIAQTTGACYWKEWEREMMAKKTEI